MKNWSLDSGERQTSANLERIRGDHRNRYQYAIDNLQGEGLFGLDMFCGNGYGTHMIASAGHHCVGIDGSSEAVEFAKRHYDIPPNTEFHHEIWAPGKLKKPKHSFDFVVSLESLEHISDAGRFLHDLSKWTKPGGTVIWSTPNQERMPFRPEIHAHHVRHYTLEEAGLMCERAGLSCIKVGYQTVYDITEDGRQRVIYPDAPVVDDEGSDGQFMILVCQKIY